jgi:tetratricopeptide (TPR) repeat protein
MWKSWASWLRATIAALALWSAGGAVSYWTAYGSIPKPPEPEFWSVCRWALSGNNIAAFVAAITSGIGMVASLVQLFGPKPASESLVRKLFGMLDRNDGRRQAEIEGLVWTEGQESEKRDDETHRLIRTDKHEQTLVDIRNGTCSPEELAAFRKALLTSVDEQGGTTASNASLYADTIIALAQSADADDRETAATVFEGNPIEAADRLMAEVGAGKVRNAERARQAASIYAPFAPSKALAAYAEAVDLDPTHVWSWIELGRLREQYEGLDSARRCFDMGLQHVTNERDRMALDGEFGGLAFARGDLSEARRRYGAAYAIAERLAASDPGNTEWRRDLSVSHNKLGNVAVTAGNLDEARAQFAKGLAISERLAAADPGNAGWQRDLSVSHERLGDVGVTAGNLDEARTQFAESLTIRERLVAADPGNARWQRDLSVSHERLGDVAAMADNIDEARVQYAKGLAIAERLAAADPGNAGWQRDLSVSHEQLGDVAVTAGNLDEARAQFAKSLTIRERLATADPGNAGWQRDLSVSHERLGDVTVTAGNIDEARVQFAKGFTIRERLSGVDPGNAEWQRDLCVSHMKLAQLAGGERDPETARYQLEAAETIMAALVERSPDHPGFARDLANVRTELARFCG